LLVNSKAHGFELVQIVSRNLVESHLSKRKETCIELLLLITVRRHKWELSEFWCKWKAM